jgi:hypothetical protein
MCNPCWLIGHVDAWSLSAEVVLMARQPEVFVRPLGMAEAERLVKITRTAKDRVRLRRAGIVLASFHGREARSRPRYAPRDPSWSRVGPQSRQGLLIV